MLRLRAILNHELIFDFRQATPGKDSSVGCARWTCTWTARKRWPPGVKWNLGCCAGRNLRRKSKRKWRQWTWRVAKTTKVRRIAFYSISRTIIIIVPSAPLPCTLNVNELQLQRDRVVLCVYEIACVTSTKRKTWSRCPSTV